MGRKRLVLVGVVAIVAASCGQSAPARSPLPEIPDDLANQVVTVPIQDDGTCVLAVGEGALVLGVDGSFGGAGVLTPGDIITGVENSPVTSDQTLVAALANHQPGDVVTVEYERQGENRQDELTLQAMPTDPDVPILGIRVDTALRGQDPLESLEGELAPDRTHLLSVDGSLYLHDPVAALWQSLGLERPVGTVVSLDGRLYTVDLSGVGLAPVGDDGDGIILNTSGRLVLSLLGVIDGLLIAGLIEVSDGLELGSAAVAGIDVAANEVVWEWDPGLLDGEVVRPIVGAASPDGSVAAITSLAGEARLYTLLDPSGEPVAGWGSENPFLPERTILAGWYDDSALAFLVGSDSEIILNSVEVNNFSYDQLAVLDSSETLRQVWAVGDGSNVVVTGNAESKIFDIGGVAATGRLVSRACEVFQIAGPSALMGLTP